MFANLHQPRSVPSLMWVCNAARTPESNQIFLDGRRGFFPSLFFKFFFLSAQASFMTPQSPDGMKISKTKNLAAFSTETSAQSVLNCA